MWYGDITINLFIKVAGFPEQVEPAILIFI